MIIFNITYSYLQLPTATYSYLQLPTATYIMVSFNELRTQGLKLFNKIHKRKHLCHHNHQIHDLARNIHDWLPNGIRNLLNRTYSPQLTQRCYFEDGVVEQLHLIDRIMQNLLLKIIKPTFKHLVHPNCYHMQGPTGVKTATTTVRQALKNRELKYFIRADVKSFYKSILHYKLIEDLKQCFHDQKLIAMLKDIITNPIATARGFINPINGVALRGPLSQFFSAIFLKPLDEAFAHMDVTYLRYQDDILILCKSLRQLKRCKSRMNQILQERGLQLSRKKTCIGEISRGFHFLGVQYLPPQSVDYTNLATEALPQLSPVPHPRTLRNAREQVKCMVEDGVSLQKITVYLFRWLYWWTRTSGTWHKHELLQLFINTCHDKYIAGIAQEMLQHEYLTLLRIESEGNSGAAAIVTPAA
jgi:RNA-directed DNA polymerase